MLKQHHIFTLISLVALNLLIGCGGGGGSSPTPPTANSVSLTVDEDGILTGTLTGTAGEGGVLSFGLAGMASSGEVELAGANFTYTPEADYFGNDSFSFTVTEGELSSSAAVNIEITAINDAPTSSTLSVQLDEDTAISEVLPVADIDNTLLEIEVVSSTENGELTINDDNTFAYSPSENYYGEDSFSFVASDGEYETSEVSISITINPINDAPVVTDQSVELFAGNDYVLDISGTDVENSALTYHFIQEFETALVTDGPSLTGELSVSVPYGTYGEDLLEYMVDDGELDSNTANVDLNIAVPQTDTTLSVNRFVSNWWAQGLNVIEFNGKIVVVGSTNGLLDDLEAGFERKVFFRVYDQDNNLEETIYVPTDTVPLTQATLIENNGKLVMLSLYREQAYFISLSEDYEVEISKPIILPYSVERTVKKFDIAHIPNVGFYLLGSDMQLTWIDFDGNIQSSQVIENDFSLEINTWVIRDVREVNEQIYISASFFVCTDDVTLCASGGGSDTGAILIKSDKEGNPLSMQLTPEAFVHDSAILSDGRLVFARNSRLSLVDNEGQIVWTRTNNGGVQSNVEVGTNDEIFWWNSRYNVKTADASRITADNELIWKTTVDMELENYDYPNELIIDEYGNMYISYVDEFVENSVTVGAFHLVHFDYSGAMQWHKISDSGPLRGNGNTGKRVTLITANKKFVTTIDGRGSPKNGFLYRADILGVEEMNQ